MVFNNCAEEYLFVGAPSLEAVKALVSWVATKRGIGNADNVMLVSDARKTLFEAPLRSETLVWSWETKIPIQAPIWEIAQNRAWSKVCRIKFV